MEGLCNYSAGRKNTELCSRGFVNNSDGNSFRKEGL